MARYIDAEKISYFFGARYQILARKEVIDEVPTADVQEVKHGKWVKVMPRRRGRNATYKCTCCNQLRSSYYNDVQDWEYCPCGAKMDKE